MSWQGRWRWQARALLGRVCSADVTQMLCLLETLSECLLRWHFQPRRALHPRASDLGVWLDRLESRDNFDRAVLSLRLAETIRQVPAPFLSATSARPFGCAKFAIDHPPTEISNCLSEHWRRSGDGHWHRACEGGKKDHWHVRAPSLNGVSHQNTLTANMHHKLPSAAGRRDGSVFFATSKCFSSHR